MEVQLQAMADEMKILRQENDLKRQEDQVLFFFFFFFFFLLFF